MASRTVLVVGATGILAPAATALRAGGDRVIAVARGGDLRGDSAISADARDPVMLAEALATPSWSDALVYGPAVSDASLAFLRRMTPGRCVVVRTSDSADPAIGPLVVPPLTLQLGWRTLEAANGWHDPVQVSEAALEVLADGEGRILGAVRPWRDRP